MQEWKKKGSKGGFVVQMLAEKMFVKNIQESLYSATPM